MVPSNTTPMHTAGPLTLGASTATNKVYSGADHIPGSPNGGVDLSGAYRYGIVATWAGQFSVGNLILQVSNNNVDWASLTGSAAPVTLNESGTFAWEGYASFKFIRIFWDAEFAGEALLYAILHRMNAR